MCFNGDIVASDGDIVDQSGNIIATLGDIIAQAGDIKANVGSIIAGGNIVAGGNITATDASFNDLSANNLFIMPGIQGEGSVRILIEDNKNAISTNTSNNTGSVTIHSDVTNAGSGSIITTNERTAIGTNTTDITDLSNTRVRRTGDTMTGPLILQSDLSGVDASFNDISAVSLYISERIDISSNTGPEPGLTIHGGSLGDASIFIRKHIQRRRDKRPQRRSLY